jgi:hypothetical protein
LGRCQKMKILAATSSWVKRLPILKHRLAETAAKGSERPLTINWGMWYKKAYFTSPWPNAYAQIFCRLA